MDASNLIVWIIGTVIALYIFSSLAVTVTQKLSVDSAYAVGNYTENPTAKILVPLVAVAFIAGILLTVLKGALKKSK